MNQPLRFEATASGQWQIRSITAIAGESLAHAPALRLGSGAASADANWSLAGSHSHLRYTSAMERDGLTPVSARLGRQEACAAALIPITKSDAWWALAQDERLSIMQASDHLGIGRDHADVVARRLFHSRDLGEPYDFLTWFEYAPEQEAAFDRLLERLRATAEWRHVTRETEVRLLRTGMASVA